VTSIESGHEFEANAVDFVSDCVSLGLIFGIRLMACEEGKVMDRKVDKKTTGNRHKLGEMMRNDRPGGRNLWTIK
jgi:hypothetical protein